MSRLPPIPCAWDGESLSPLPRFAKLCDAHLVIGERYMIELVEERSAASHRQYFAALKEAWQNLSEEAGGRFPTTEHLRKYALIRCGYADTATMVASSMAEAQRLAAFIRPCDEFSLVTVEGRLVTRWTAKSQSTKAMSKKEFEASKRAVLDFVSSLIGVDADQLQRNRAA